MKVFSDIVSKSTPLAFSLDAISSYQCEFFYPDKLSIFFIESGRATVKINSESFPICGASIICLNETESLTLNTQHTLQGKLLTFSPTILRDYFNFRNIRVFDHCFTPEDISIVLYLSIFFQRFHTITGTFL